MQLEEYDPIWQDKFFEESKLIKSSFGNLALSVQHIGSTAIKGIKAKPIVDIAVLVEQGTAQDQLIQKAESLGYMAAPFSTERLFFKKGDPVQYHLSITEKGKTPYWERQLLFRDYLNNHPKKAKEYEDLKDRLISIDSEAGQVYTDGKNDFVAGVLRDATLELYIGAVVEESLADPSIVYSSGILSTEVSQSLGWYIYKVRLNRQQIEVLSRSLKEGKWYAHFWKGNKVLAVFKDKVFEFDHNDRSTWKPAIEYGRSLGIPDDQLDFPIERDIHRMHLENMPFEQIKNSSKTIEARLFDEKRAKLKIGDIILFESNSHPGNILETEVVNLFKRKSFEQLYNSFPTEMFGGESREYLLEEIYDHCTKEDEERFGVLGIEIRLVEDV
jgi:GrpB-like predicted nucleotidyltransferase (UPF0157 family)/ASC-1-like (ASCH) protein